MTFLTTQMSVGRLLGVTGVALVCWLGAGACGGDQFTDSQQGGGAGGSGVAGSGGTGAAAGVGGSGAAAGAGGSGAAAGAGGSGAAAGAGGVGGAGGTAGTGGSGTGGTGGCQGNGECAGLSNQQLCLEGRCVNNQCKQVPTCEPSKMCCNGACQQCCSVTDCAADVANCQVPRCENGTCSVTPLCTAEQACCPGTGVDNPGVCGECCGAGIQPVCAPLNQTSDCVIGTCAILGHVCHQTPCSAVNMKCCDANVEESVGCCPF